MKSLYLAYTEITVHGISLASAAKAKKNASDWSWQEGMPAPEELEIKELAVPDATSLEDFNSCADVREYEDAAEILNNIYLS